MSDLLQQQINTPKLLANFLNFIKGVRGLMHYESKANTEDVFNCGCFKEVTDVYQIITKRICFKYY